MEEKEHVKPTRRRRRRSYDGLFNLLTILLLAGALVVAGISLLIYLNPQSALNPFKLPPIPTLAQIPTATRTQIAPTATATITSTATPFPTLRPSSTPLPTDTPFTVLTLTPPAPQAPTATVTRRLAGFPFVVAGNGPQALPNIASPELGCNWMGVGGEIRDLSGAPKTQVIIVLGGTLSGNLVDPSGQKYSLSGVAPKYGVAGYEFVLADKPVASRQTLWIQLLDQNEAPISDKIYFDTFDDCNRNLIFLSFKQVR
jgi:hypothetical protein